MTKVFDSAKFFLGWPISILALLFMGKLLASQSSNVATHIQNINLLLLFGSIACFILYFLLRSILWHLLLKEKGHSLPFFEVAYLWQISEIRRFVPGNIWSFLSRSFLFTQKGIDKKTIWRLMLLEIQFLLVSCLVLSLLSLSLLFSTILSWIPYKEAISSLLPVLIFLGTGFFVYKTKHFSLLLLSVLYMFLYGLGTYLAIASIMYLNPVHVLSFIGLFVFSLLVGYLSFITPMGLGVREGVVTSVLSSSLQLTTAALGAIFSRVVLIIAELLFFIVTILGKQMRWRISEKHFSFLILAGMILTYFLYFTSISFLRHDNLYTGRFDLGNMDQTVWNSLHGNIFEFTNPNGVNNMSRLGFHADFILVLFSPLYVIWSNPKTLLLVQTVVLGSGALFVYLLSQNILKKTMISLTFAAIYLLNPSVQYSNIYDFHPVTLATTLLLATFYFLYKKQYVAFIFFLLLSVMSKEQLWITAAFFGLYMFFIHKKRVFGASIFGVSVAVFYYLFEHAIPSARGSSHFALTYYSDFGDSSTSIIRNILFSPAQIVRTIFQESRITYLYQLFMPLGVLSFLSPYFLFFAIGDFAINLLSNNPQLYQIYYQYTAAITPFLFISAIYGTKKVLKKFPFIPPVAISFYLFASTLYIAYEFGPLPGAKNPNLDMITKQKSYAQATIQFLQNIPHDKKVATINNLGAHVSQRKYVYAFPLGMNEADIIVFNFDDPYSQPSPKIQKKIMNDLQKSKKYTLSFQKGPVFAFEKK